MRYTVVDFESTGLPSETELNHRIVEAGWCNVVQDESGIFVESPASVLTLPKREIPPEAKAVHHITEEMCERDGIPVEHAFRTIMGESPDYFVAHNTDMERHFFGGGEVKWICTHKVAVRVWPDAPRHSNNVLRYWLGLDLDPDLATPSHRAGPDAYVTAHLLRAILLSGKCTLDEMVRWSSGPALLPRLNFGKHKGVLFKDAPRDYLEWIAHKSDLGKDEKATARYWLKLAKPS
jgi:exodeoxyribonuclease X